MPSNDTEWSEEELAASVEAYLQMQKLEQLGLDYNKAAVRRMLLAGPSAGRTTTEQRMQNISYIMETLGRRPITGYKPLGNVGAKTETTLRHLILDLSDPTAAPIAFRPPIDPKGRGTRKLLPTGYWILVANPTRWSARAWLASGNTGLFYRVSEHNRDEVQAGDLAVLRVNAAASHRPHIIALLEATGAPSERRDPDAVGYRNPAEAADIAWRAPFRLMADLSTSPVETDDLPDDLEFNYLKRALQASTIPLPRKAYAEVFRRARVDTLAIKLDQAAQTLEGATQLVRDNINLDPKARERVSRFIERGRVGEAVKAQRAGRCQLCEKLGRSPVAFTKRNGGPYAEAHHVYHVSALLPGTLAANNIMVLCPNHHREAHYGDFEIVEHRAGSWIVRLGEQALEVERTSI